MSSRLEAARQTAGRLARALALAFLVTSAGAQGAVGQQSRTLLDAPCTGSPDRMVSEPNTGRTYMLDYPCDLRAGEQVTFVLSLHGGGSSASWQRRYFPLFDQKERHRLVIATPFSPTRRWSEEDDAYLRNIVTTLTDAIGRENVRAFWLAGHSQGGMTSRRIVCSPFFATRVDGFLSLSGGRLGGAAPRAANAGRPAQVGEPLAPTAAAAPEAAAAPAEPTCDFSHIFAVGEHEIASLPATSSWAAKLGCDARVRRADIVDTQPGQVHDGSRQNPGSAAWGLLPRPGRAEVFVYPDCDGGRVVADVVRIDKGHTEGLEPVVTEALVALMVSASGGKVR
jgi:poly(3-hydroxybutyrate) depolymerase